MFQYNYLTYYLQPQFIVIDDGGEFKREFKQFFDYYGIEIKPTTSHNDQITRKCNH
jgi:hypothetical protein